MKASFLYLLLGVLLLIISIIDIKKKEFSNYFIIPILFIGLYISPIIFLKRLIVAILLFILISIFPKNILGGGDLKIILALFTINIEMFLFIVFISLILTSIYHIITKKITFPYMPFVFIAYILYIIKGVL